MIAVSKITNNKIGLVEGKAYKVVGQDSGSAYKSLIKVKTQIGNVWCYKDNFMMK